MPQPRRQLHLRRDHHGILLALSVASTALLPHALDDLPIGQLPDLGVHAAGSVNVLGVVPVWKGLLASRGVKSVPIPAKSPNCNAVTERFICTVREECLDHFVIVGERHLCHLLKQFVAHYHAERYHQGLDGRIIPTNGEPCHADPYLSARQPRTACRPSLPSVAASNRPATLLARLRPRHARPPSARTWPASPRGRGEK